MDAAPVTVQDVLAFPELQRAHPRVLAGRAGLSRTVSAAHVLESSKVRGLLRGGEVVLLTGVALPDDNAGLRTWVEDLQAAGASAAVVQLGERWAEVPAVLVRAADAAGLPLVGLTSAVPFLDVVRAVLTAVTDSSLGELQASARVHELFHRMALEGRSDTEVVMAVCWLTGASAVLETTNHHVLAFQAPHDRDSEALLHDWERRSRRDGAGEGWLVRDVGARGQSWGRLIADLGPDVVPSRLQELVVERGAENIALRRAIGGDAPGLEQDARATVLSQLLRGYYRDEEEGRRRAEAVGFPLAGRTLVGVAVRAPGARQDQVRRVVSTTAQGLRVELLMGADHVGLASLPAECPPLPELHRWALRLRQELGPTAVVGAGSPVRSLGALRGSLEEAAGAARGECSVKAPRTVVLVRDTRVRGLLAQLSGDPRLQTFLERELGPLLDPDRTAELDALRAYLAAGRNKSAAAQAARMSRPSFYLRLQRAAELLEADLDDPEVCLSLHLALVGLEIAAPGRGSPSAWESRSGPRVREDRPGAEAATAGRPPA